MGAMNTMSPGLQGWTSPVSGGTWPDKGPAIAAWMVTGIEAWRAIETRYAGKGSPGSFDEADRLTIQQDGHTGEIGPTALLIVGGATDMFRGLAALYYAHAKFPLTRAHLPVLRSLQEHCGRVMWLLGPGIQVGPSSATLPDDPNFTNSTANFHDRVARMRMLREEHLDDRLAAAKKECDAQGEVQATAEGALSRGGRSRARKRANEPFPGPTAFAELCEEQTQLLHLMRPEKTRAAYGRVSETAHGGLLGLLSDSRGTADGRRAYTSDPADHEAVAVTAGSWWLTAVGFSCSYFGWEWEADFKPFDDARRTLLP